jgi:DNA-binding transcriptional regulator LsrR (DeoR family)
VRAGTEQLVDRILDMVEICRTEPMTRKQLAYRWNVTPRTVNNVIYRAQDLFGVMIAHKDGVGYTVLDMGIIDPRKLRTRRFR